MKIALIHPTAPPVEGEIERLLELQVRLLRRRGHCVSLGCYEGGNQLETDCHIPLSREASRKALCLYLEAALAGSDVVIFHAVGTMPCAPELTAALRELPRRLASARWLCWVHAMACMDGAFLPFGSQEIAFWMSTPCPDWEYVANNAWCAHLVHEAYGVPCTLLDAGADCAAELDLPLEILSLAEKFRLWDADCILLHPTRLEPRRGIETSLRILEQLHARSIRAALIVAAEAPFHGKETAHYAAQLRFGSRTANLEKFVLLAGENFVPTQKNLSALRRVADAVLLPHPPQNPEVVFWEAALSGLPVFHPEPPLPTDPAASVRYATTLSPSGVAEWIIRQMGVRDTIQARRLARGRHRWLENYEKSLASLVEKPHKLSPT